MITFIIFIWIITTLYDTECSYNEHEEQHRIEFELKCQKLNIRDVNLAYDLLYSKDDDYALANKYGINVDSVWQQRWRIKKKFHDNNIDF